MKVIFGVILLPTLAFAQGQPTGPAAGGCGPAAVHFEVQTTKQNPAMPQPPSGRALVYFIQDDTHFMSRPRPTARIGIDGEWVGATRSNSFFHIEVDPGEHHLCASWQSFVAVGAAHTAAAAHLVAEAGHTYYFLVRNSVQRQPPVPAEVEFSPLDSDEGQLLASKFSLSTSHPK